MSEVLMKLEGVYKRFPGVVALDNVNLEIHAGEVLALVGENGAGKSTLIKIMSGAYTPSEGTLYVAEKKYEKLSPSEALHLGIAAIHQELNNVNGLSIAENIFLNNQPRTKAGMVDYKTMWEASRKAQEAVGLQYLSPKTLMNRLSTAEKQLVEIARAYVRDLKVMIMDEPTSALNQEEINKLYQTHDLIAAMESDTGIPFRRLKVDGGASRDAFLMQFQADITDKEICRPRIRETTALGVAFLAGLAVGFWDSLEEIRQTSGIDRVFTPGIPEERRAKLLDDWHRAVDRSLDWAGRESGSVR